ncbi:MAG TPA: putative zinc-binding peptidase [Ferruginibacter sp.]|jgi:hypothetical protein|nr:putative zinc-binding peptidase [Ferruginibacter sp.]
MKLYTCGHCNNPLYFENNVCLNCHHAVGFDADTISLITLEPRDNNTFSNINKSKDLYRFCDNANHGTCNWLLPKESTATFCKACALNRIIPTLDTEQNIQRWSRIEIAKHRLVYSLLQLKLPVQPKEGDSIEGIAFDFMADTSPEEKVMTGHNDGTITINIDEADEAERVRHKLDLGERYRTLLGHFRHEIGHYYWDVLLKNDPENFRKIFGDEQIDYSQALETYYKIGAPSNWVDNYISPYATAHPWEDWAETWAHYLHMMDTVETAFSFGMDINPRKVKERDMKASINKDPYTVDKFDDIIKMWLPLTFALNSLSRSMGHADFYPFVISKPVIDKLRFIHDTCRTKRA